MSSSTDQTRNAVPGSRAVSGSASSAVVGGVMNGRLMTVPAGSSVEVARVLDLLVVQLGSLAAAQQQRCHVGGGEVGAALAKRGHLGPRDRVVREQDGADGGRDDDRATGSHGVWTLASSSRKRTPRCRIASYTRPTMASAFTRIDHVGIAVADLDARGRGLRAPDRVRAGAPPAGGVRRHRGGHVRGGRVAHRAARQHRAGVEDRRLPGPARRRPPPRRLRRRRRSGQPRPLRRRSACSCSTRVRDAARPAGWSRSSIPRRRAGCSPSCASPTRRPPGRPRERSPRRRAEHQRRDGIGHPARALLRRPAGRLPPPGEYPYTRGIRAEGYRSRLWTMRQYAGFGSAEQTNQRFHYLLRAGQSGLSVAFDLPTQMGYDSDDPIAHGEVGKVGVAIDSLDDMELLMRGIPQDQVTTSMTINAPAAVLLLLYELAAERKGIAADDARRNDPERHPQGVRGARHLHLSPAPVDAPGHRHVRVLRASGCRAGTPSASAATTSARRAPRRRRRSRSR